MASCFFEAFGDFEGEG
jgi:hypothetical protein